MTREQLFAAFFFAALIFLIYQFYVVFSVFLVPLSWAAMLALVFFPINQWLVVRLRGRDTLAAFLLATVVILVVMVPTILLSLLLASESVAMYDWLQEVIESGRWHEWVTWFQASAPGQVWQRWAPRFVEWKIDVGSLALKFSNALSGFLVGQATDIAKNAVRFVVNFFLTTFALFFFFRDGERLAVGLRGVIPMEAEHKAVLFERFYETVSAVVQGTIITAAAQGTLAGLGFWVLGVPFALVWACATAFMSLLPAGSALVWVAVDIYLFSVGEWVRGLILLAWGTLGISGVDNIIRPLVIGGRTQIPTVFLFFGLLGGLRAYGFLGLFIAPALIAILVAFIRIYRDLYATDEHAAPPARGAA